MLPSQITANIPQISSHKGPNGQWNWPIGFVIWINRWSPPERFGFRNHYSWDFPGDPVAKNPSSNVGDVSPTPGWGTKIPYVVRQLNLCTATTEPSSSREPRKNWDLKKKHCRSPEKLCAYLEEGVATHSCILAWRAPWTEEPGGPQSLGPHRVRHDWSESACRTQCQHLIGDRWPFVTFSMHFL